LPILSRGDILGVVTLGKGFATMSLQQSTQYHPDDPDGALTMLGALKFLAVLGLVFLVCTAFRRR